MIFFVIQDLKLYLVEFVILYLLQTLRIGEVAHVVLHFVVEVYRFR